MDSMIKNNLAVKKDNLTPNECFLLDRAMMTFADDLLNFSIEELADAPE